MLIGLPKEIKSDEYRVALLPSGVEDLTRAGHKVLVERGAGAGSGIADDDYAACGAEIVNSHAEVFAADTVIKVTEPLPAEWPL
ncbi:MAG: alanine dehydrogenase, partial [Planctomycetaceae bacterium]